MKMASVGSDDELKKNWIVCAHSLNIFRDALGPRIQKEIDKFHDTLKKNHRPVCGNCDTKNINFDAKKKTWNITCPQCQPWLTDVAAKHAQCKARTLVYKDNSDISKWQNDSWEIAKFFMPRGQKGSNSGPDKSDSAALISMILNCKQMHNAFDKSSIKHLQQVRNMSHACLQAF
jgi:hypothetical protein